MSSNEMFDVVIAGAGLSGLTAAMLCHEAGLKTHILEASDKPGGRIQSFKDTETGRYIADLGPSWVWPIHQPVAARWLEQLGIEKLQQYETGDTALDINPHGMAQRQFVPGQHGISRLVGGPGAITEALIRKLPKDLIKLESRVTEVSDRGDFLEITYQSERHHQIESRNFLGALPPRMALQSISWPDTLDPPVKTIMGQTPTWMAQQAKAVITYDKPFWRDQGLSGRIASRLGPLVEAHDMSNPDDPRGILFGFIGLPHSLRAQHKDELPDAIITQLIRCFGEEVANPTELEIMDWATLPTICSKQDRETEPTHPEKLPEIIRKPHLGGKLHFAGAETANLSPGLIEGAIEAGERAAIAVLSRVRIH